MFFIFKQCHQSKGSGSWNGILKLCGLAWKCRAIKDHCMVFRSFQMLPHLNTAHQKRNDVDNLGPLSHGNRKGDLVPMVTPTTLHYIQLNTDKNIFFTWMHFSMSFIEQDILHLKNLTTSFDLFTVLLYWTFYFLNLHHPHKTYNDRVLGLPLCKNLT